MNYIARVRPQSKACYRNFPGFGKMMLSEKSVVTKFFSAYMLAQQGDYSQAFKKGMFPAYLGENFFVIVKYDNTLITDRKSRFIPMGQATPQYCKIELNSFHVYDPKTNWVRIFWHEFAHLIDKYDFFQLSFMASIIGKSHINLRKIKMPLSCYQKNIINYYTKPLDTGEITKRYYSLKYERMVQEASVECFALIMTILTLGLTPKVIKQIEKAQVLVYTYIELIHALIDNFNFKGMNIRVTSRKKHELKKFFTTIKNQCYQKYGI